MTPRSKLREIASKATPGPWANDDKVNTFLLTAGRDRDGAFIYPACTCYSANSEANVAFIATFNPSTVLSLLDALDEAERAISEARDNLRHEQCCAECAESSCKSCDVCTAEEWLSKFGHGGGKSE